MSEQAEQQAVSRVLVVANRLPVTISKDQEGYSFRMSSGGLATAMNSIKNLEMIWVGWPGCEIPLQDQEDIKQKLLKDIKAYPVYLDEETIDLHYNGFSNNVLWPLFHYIQPTSDPNEQETVEKYWEGYQKANNMFADAIMELVSPGDTIWVQDYHLMLLPKMIVERLQGMDVSVGWFLHTPFPSYEVYRMLPYREAVLEGVLSCHLVGFHVAEYVRHFLNACTRILGLLCTDTGVENIGEEMWFCRTSAFAIGIEPDSFSSLLNSEQVLSYQSQLRETWKDKSIILGVDRLDYIKGIPHKLLAFEQLLKNHEDWIGRVVLIQIAVPSRESVREYQELKSMTHEIVGRINSTYGTIGYIPVHYLDQSVDKHRLIALYSAADVMFITSLRDGMNLVSYEYVACQESNFGILVLSEFAGASKVLGAGAMLVNPWNVEETSSILNDALLMEKDEKQGRYEFCNNYIRRANIHFWAESFLKTLKEAKLESSEQMRRVPKMLRVGSQLDQNLQEIFNKAKSASKVLIIYDEGGPFIQQKYSGNNFISQRRLINTFESLSQLPNVEILLMTGKKYDDSVLKFATPEKIQIAVENGCKIRKPGEDWVENTEDYDFEWLESVIEVVKYFADRTPGSSTYTTQVTIDWSYANARYEIGTNQSRDLFTHLRAGPLVNVPGDMVLTGASTVQIRDVRVTKASVVKKFLQEFYDQSSYCIVTGNFNWKDEDDIIDSINDLKDGSEDGENLMLNKAVIRMGRERSLADYYFPDIQQFTSFIQELEARLKGEDN